LVLATAAAAVVISGHRPPHWHWQLQLQPLLSSSSLVLVTAAAVVVVIILLVGAGDCKGTPLTTSTATSFPTFRLPHNFRQLLHSALN